VAALTVGLLVMFDGHDENAGRAPTTVPTTVVRVPMTLELDIVRRGPWYLRFDTSGVQPTSPEIRGATLASTLQFDADGTVRGGTGFGGGCDDFTADYIIANRALTIGPLTGHLGCTATGAVDIRDRLRAVTAYEATDDTLVLEDRGGQRLLVYSRWPTG
jgi:META domain